MGHSLMFSFLIVNTQSKGGGETAFQRSFNHANNVTRAKKNSVQKYSRKPSPPTPEKKNEITK